MNIRVWFVRVDRAPRRAVACLILAAMTCLAALRPAVAKPYVLSLPQGTPVLVRALTDVTSNRVKTGDTVSLTVVRDVRVKNVVFVHAGAPARGTVLLSHGAGVGFRGELMVGVLDVQAKDGTWIPIRTRALPGNGLTHVLPDDVYDWASPVFPNGKNERLSYQHVLNCWVDQTRTFVVTPHGRHTTVALAPPVTPRGKRLIKLAGGTVIRLQPARDITSGTAVTGGSLDFVVVAPVVVNGVTVIAQGAPAKGTVLLSRKAQRANKGGVLVISIDRVQAVDGSWVSLATTDAGRGRGNKLLGAAASVLLVPGVGLAIEGREQVVHQSREIDTSVFHSACIAVSPK